MKIKYDIIFGMGFDFIAILVVFVIILFSMVLHEMAHAYTAFFLGDTTAKEEGRLSVNPLKHIDPFLSIMIPLLLFILGGPIFGGAKPVPIVQKKLKGGEWGMAIGLFFKQLVLANLGFMIFNLIPIPPLDGSRILYAIAPDVIRDFLTKIESSLGVFLILVLIYIFGNYLSIFTSNIMVAILKFFYFIVGR